MTDQTRFRTVLGQFATGVVLVTALTPDGPVGMSMNSFTSVSLDPPLLALSAAHSSTTWPALRAQGKFGITILGEQHADLCRLFSDRGADRFGDHEWSSTTAGHPTVHDALAWIDCDIATIHPAGDHELVLVVPTVGLLGGGERPLVFQSGRMTGLRS